MDQESINLLQYVLTQLLPHNGLFPLGCRMLPFPHHWSHGLTSCDSQEGTLPIPCSRRPVLLLLKILFAVTASEAALKIDRAQARWEQAQRHQGAVCSGTKQAWMGISKKEPQPELSHQYQVEPALNITSGDYQSGRMGNHQLGTMSCFGQTGCPCKHTQAHKYIFL